MGADMADENNCGVVVDFHNESEGVALDIEDDPVTWEHIGRGKTHFDVGG